MRLPARPPKNAAIRGYVEAALHFVQTIPYDRLEQRDLKTLSGFLLPTQMIAQNRGDCDTKSTALAAILAHILPNQKVIMVIIPNHAFLGIEMKPEKNDRTYEYQGKNYVLLETAGPAVLKVGQISPLSQTSLQKRKVLEIIPFIVI